MKKLIPLIGLLMIAKLCFSQVSVGVGYIHNSNSDRKYTKSLNGVDFNLKYYLSDRFSLSSDFILYNNVKTYQIKYNDWGVDLNGEINVIKKDALCLYGILGLGFQQSSATALDPSMISPFGNSYVTNTLLKLNLGIGSQYKIFNKVWLKLNVLTNSSYEIIVNPGILYRFK